MNRRIFKIFAIGLLSVFSLNAHAGDDDTKETLFNPVNYAVAVWVTWVLLPIRM